LAISQALRTKSKFHDRSSRAGRAGRFSMNYQARLKDKSSCGQSLQAQSQACSAREAAIS
jgi:hypothetical protein